MALRTPAVALALTVVVAASLAATRAKGQVESFTGVAHSPTEAEHRATAMLDRIYLLGAVRTEPPLGYRADHPHQYEVQNERWLAMNSTPSAVASELLTHPPAGFAIATARELTPSVNAVTTELRPVGQGTSLMHVLDVTAKTAGAGRVMVLLQAVVGWVPPRTAAETIAEGVTAAELTSGFGDGPEGAGPLQRTLSAAELRALAAALNARPTVSPYSGNACPEGNLGLVILTVHYRDRVAVYQIDIGVCGQVQVQVDRVTQPNLAGGAALSGQIADLLSTTPAHG